MSGFKNPYQSIADAELCSEEFARREDEKDELSKLRQEFVIPTKGDLKNKKYGFQQKAERASNHGQTATQNADGEESIYFCGNSLGLQPQRTREYVNRYLDTWASKGVFGHFTNYEEVCHRGCTWTMQPSSSQPRLSAHSPVKSSSWRH